MKKDLNFANRQRNARTAIIKNLERLHPGMIVCSEAFDIQHPDPVINYREKSLCLQMKAGFVKVKIPVQVVLTKVGAYVLRSKEGLKRGLPEDIYSDAVGDWNAFGARLKKGVRRA